MDIKIPDSWLREYLKTKATPKQIAQDLSLCSQSVEKLNWIGNDWLYEIEVTSNRPDCFSVYGIARELGVILPRFGIAARFRSLPTNKIPTGVNDGLSLKVKIAKSSLCPRFTAMIFDNITFKPSPKVIQERLEKSDIRALNNVVDISNYLMLELGQPMHTFDYDKIKGHKMILRESCGGEKITTLDGQIRPLSDGAIIIEDGEGRIVDLCGIMGGENSAVDENTKRVLLFIQTYDSVKIRQTCQQLSFRTEASSRFEKGIDPEGVTIAMEKAAKMFEKNCGAKIASKLIDVYPNQLEQKKIKLDFDLVNKIIGVVIPKNEVVAILKSLGFSIVSSQSSRISVFVPHWRHADISLPEDLIEEIARIYGYHKLPSSLPEGQTPQDVQNPAFIWEKRVKEALKYWGMTETVTYSMISLAMLQKMSINPNECLKIANPLTNDLVFLRPSLIPSLLEALGKNQPEPKVIKMFELANIYVSSGENKLPDEVLMLTGTITGDAFYKTKGITETLMADLGINDYKMTPYQLKKTFYGKNFRPSRSVEITVGRESLGIIGEISPLILSRFGIKGRVAVFDLDFGQLAKYATTFKKYTPVPKYPAIIEDLSFVVPSKTFVGEMLQVIKATSPIIQSVELLDSYKDTRTFRITYQSTKKTLTEREVERIRETVVKKIKEKFRAKLRQQG